MRQLELLEGPDEEVNILRPLASTQVEHKTVVQQLIWQSGVSGLLELHPFANNCAAGNDAWAIQSEGQFEFTFGVEEQSLRRSKQRCRFKEIGLRLIV